MTGSSLVVPLVLWGRKAPTHCVSTILMAINQDMVVTGSNDGQIVLWDIGKDMKLVPRSMLFGHTAAVCCLAQTNFAQEQHLLVSSSENGEMCVWDLADGRCVEHSKTSSIHVEMIAYQMTITKEIRLFTYGFYPEIHVYDPLTLELLFSLSCKVAPDWISAMFILHPVKRQDDVVVAMSNSGTAKVWTLTGNETKAMEPLYEDESKQIRCLNAISLKCCLYNQRTALIVCAKYWQIYDAGDFSLLCSMSSPTDERWAGGDFLAVDRVITWTAEGTGYLYRLPLNCVAESKEFRSRVGHLSEGGQPPQLYCIAVTNDMIPLTCPPIMRFCCGHKGKLDKVLLRGDSLGTVVIWNIPDVSERELMQMTQERFSEPPELQPTSSLSLEESWRAVSPHPAGIVDQLYNDMPYLDATSSIFIPSSGHLVLGREDGSIVIIPATKSVILQFLDGVHQTYKKWPAYRVLQGHTGKVTCLLYPHLENARYESHHLLSGGIDFSVCLWDMYSGTLMHRFCVHGGEVTQLLATPSNCNPRILQSICSVASDHSVALLGLKERRCVMLASRHLFPVQIIKWRPLDDFMIVGTTDGSVSVWQMETGHLDRVVHGLIAEEILTACDETTTGTEEVSGTQSMISAVKRRNITATRNTALRNLQAGFAVPHTPVLTNQEIAVDKSYPLQIQGLRTNSKDPDSHVLFFDIEALIVQLLSEDFACMSPGSLEAHGLISQAEQAKQQSLHQSSNPAKISGFLAKVKDKAGEMSQQIQHKVESGFTPIDRPGYPGSTRHSSSLRDLSVSNYLKRPGYMNLAEENLTLDIGQLLMSCLHAWDLDSDLDHLCISKLGLLKPFVPVSFGVLSAGGFMSLLLPTHKRKHRRHSRLEKQTSIQEQHQKLLRKIVSQSIDEDDRGGSRSSSVEGDSKPSTRSKAKDRKISAPDTVSGSRPDLLSHVLTRSAPRKISAPAKTMGRTMSASPLTPVFEVAQETDEESELEAGYESCGDVSQKKLAFSSHAPRTKLERHSQQYLSNPAEEKGPWRRRRSPRSLTPLRRLPGFQPRSPERSSREEPTSQLSRQERHRRPGIVQRSFSEPDRREIEVLMPDLKAVGSDDNVRELKNKSFQSTSSGRMTEPQQSVTVATRELVSRKATQPRRRKSEPCQRTVSSGASASEVRGEQLQPVPVSTKTDWKKIETSINTGAPASGQVQRPSHKPTDEPRRKTVSTGTSGGDSVSGQVRQISEKPKQRRKSDPCQNITSGSAEASKSGGIHNKTTTVSTSLLTNTKQKLSSSMRRSASETEDFYKQGRTGSLEKTDGEFMSGTPEKRRHGSHHRSSTSSHRVKSISRMHWELSGAVTTTHLISVIAVANTLMGTTASSFSLEERQKLLLKKHRPKHISVDGSEQPQEENLFTVHQAQIKQGWSLLAALHCVLLPELVGLKHYKSPLLHMLARRWQDRCLEVREAAQALLLAELRRIGPDGRRLLVEEWGPYLPTYVDPRVSLLQEGSNSADDDADSQDGHNLGGESVTQTRASPKFTSRQKQATAIVMLGVIGAEFGQEIETSKNKPTEDPKKKKVLEGFGGGNYSLARHTSKALTFLLLSPPTNRLPAHTPIRRAALDLIGRGFTVWEPHLDESAVLLGMLELCSDADKLLRGISLGLPLSPAADSCRTARHSLSLIATARPAAFITTMAKEVARYTAMQANAPAQNVNLHSHVLVKSKPEILRVIELLIDKMQTEVADLLIEVMDIVIHCLDQSQIKSKGLNEVFPAVTRFTMLSYCSQTKRLAAGAKNGLLAIYELRASKSQHIPAHNGAITAVSFSPDGKYICSYSLQESKLCFWQAATSLFGIGSAQVRCVRSYNTVPISPTISNNPMKIVKLVWVSSKTVILLVADGTEYKYNI